MSLINKFTVRSNQKELLDEADIPADLLNKNLKELDIFNRTIGGHFISLQGIKQLITDRHKIYHVVDLGCGSGVVLKVIADWARLNNYQVLLTGVDRNANAIKYLKTQCIGYPEIIGISADYYDFLYRTESIDIVHCSLFCHHLNDNELIRLFGYFWQHVRTGFVINDLRRHWLAYYSVWLFTRLLKGTKLSKNDGPISVLRGFNYNEIMSLFTQARITNVSIKKAWAFRFLIVGNTSKYECTG